MLKLQKRFRASCVMLLLLGCKQGAHNKTENGWSELFSDDLANASFVPGSWQSKNGVLTATVDEVLWTKGSYEILNYHWNSEMRFG